MKNINLEIKNERLKLTIALHIVSQAVTIDTANKRALGQIHSFKTDKVLDAYNENGQLQPALVTPFVIENFDTTKGIDKQVSDYIDANLSTIVSK